MIHDFTKHNLQLLGRVHERFSMEGIFYVTMGGFAVDGYAGKLTRDHGDVDLIVHKEDYRAVEQILGTIGIWLKRAMPLPGEVVPYKYVSNNKELTVHVLEPLTDGRTVRLAFWATGWKEYPVTAFEPREVSIERTIFTAISKRLLIRQKQDQFNHESRFRSDNSEKTQTHRQKRIAAEHDLGVLHALVD